MRPPRSGWDPPPVVAPARPPKAGESRGGGLSFHAAFSFHPLRHRSRPKGYPAATRWECQLHRFGTAQQHLGHRIFRGAFRTGVAADAHALLTAARPEPALLGLHDVAGPIQQFAEI